MEVGFVLMLYQICLALIAGAIGWVTCYLSIRPRLQDLIDNIKYLKQLATTDTLTGLVNRTGFENEFNHISALLQRENYQRSVQQLRHLGYLVIDVDFFKNINDTYGHAIGDEVLVELAQLIQHTLRESDIVGRFGGEEFMVALPRVSPEEVANVAEKLRVTIAEKEFSSEPLKITVSIGVVCTSHPVGQEVLFKQADRALYRAKNRGRNQVIVFNA